MQAVGGQLVTGYVVPHDANRNAIHQQFSDDVEELLFWAGCEFALVDEGSKFGTVLVPLERNRRVSREDGCEPPTRFARLIAQLGQVLKVLRNVAIVPGDQDGFDA